MQLQEDIYTGGGVQTHTLYATNEMTRVNFNKQNNN